MKIAYIIPSLKNYGPVRVVKDTIDHLPLPSKNIKVFYFDEEVPLKFNCETQKISLSDNIGFNAFDIIHTHSLRPELYMWLNRKKFSGKHIVTLHNYNKEDLAWQYNKLVSAIAFPFWIHICRTADLIVLLSRHMKRYYTRFFPEQKLAYVYNGRNLAGGEKNLVPGDPDVNAILKLKNNYQVIGANCFLTRRKGIDQVIRALPTLPGYALVVIGDGKALAELKQLAQQHQVGNRCLFPGYRPDAFRFLHLYDFYIMPSRTEGFPLALLEAASYQKCCICSDLPVFKEIYTPEEVSFFELENIGSLVRAIRKASENKEEYQSRIFKKFCEQYTSKKMGENYYKIYQSVLP
ncbi:MAG: glycosyltransferase family 4 protein [Prolixibacteraceae bacterium]